VLGTVTALVIVIVATMIGYSPVPTTEVLITTSPHLLFMIIFPGLIALLGWNVGVKILSPINALLFINFTPITTLVVSTFQGYNVTTFDLIGTIFIIVALVANNMFIRMKQNATSIRHVKTAALREQMSES